MIASKELFYDDFNYKKYLYAVSFAQQINDYLDKGFLVFEDNHRITGRFVFEHSFYGTPIVGLKEDNSTSCVITESQDDDEKFYIENSAEEIFEIFKKFNIVNPKHIEHIK